MLNEQQKEAVFHDKGPLLILAGAGTGKTRVLTKRIINIINSYQAGANQILAVTFTNKAASEMRQRIEEEIGPEANNIWSGTFHSIASRILKRHPEVVGLKPNFTIIDSDDQMRLIKQILKDLEIDLKSYPAKNYLYQIERYKDKSIRPKDLAKSYMHNLPQISKIYNLYQNRLVELNSVDFGDLLLYNLEIFGKSPETLTYYQKKFHYILVDEYQDTNNCQYLWLLKLAGEDQNICAVGDDDQSIYSWRGAEVKNILRFSKDFKGTKIVRLEQNYRSTSNILKVASHVIANNPNRHDKTLWSEEEDGEKVNSLSFFDDRSEAAGVSKIINELQNKLQSDVKLNDIAVLVRAGYQTRLFEESFISNSIPYRIIGGLRFFDRREIKDVIAYLRVILNDSDDLALQRIINLPRRGIGSAGLNKLLQKSRDSNSSLFATIKREVESDSLKGKSAKSLAKFIANILYWQKLRKDADLSVLASDVLEESGYLEMWKNEKTPDAASRVDNLNEFISGLGDFTNLEQFLEHVSLVSGNRDSDKDKDMVSIMTIHGAKGLEFNSVFIPGLEEGVFPSSRAIDEDSGIEEERRLFYVAMTRAKKDLYLTNAQNRVVFGSFQASISSRFLMELPEEALNNDSNFDFYDDSLSNIKKHSNFIEKDAKEDNGFLYKRIFHQKFGYGKVVKICDDKLDIVFEKTGQKTIVKKFVNLA